MDFYFFSKSPCISALLYVKGGPPFGPPMPCCTASSSSQELAVHRLGLPVTCQKDANLSP